MKKLIKNILIVLIGLSAAACDSYFDSDPSDIINSEDYISSQSEMYSGFLGIITKMQTMGDQAVFLSDVRADFLEPTANAPQDLWELYYYNNSTTNTYADPVDFYAVIIACNDYLDKMFAYKDEVGDNMDSSTEANFEALISSTLRIKAWVYLNLGKIYGTAIYFDDPITSIQDIDDSSIFTKLTSLDAIVDKCFDLLDTGVNGIDGSLSMEWGDWLDPEDPTNSDYEAWKYITPDYLCMRCELCLLKGSDYAWVREQILSLLSETFQEDGYKYRLNAGFTNNYYRIFSQGTYYSRESISSIIYDYANDQTNDLITYFANRTPAVFYLRPTTYGMSKYNDVDTRGYGCNFLAQDGDTVMAKYHSSFRWRAAYQSDASIPLYRAHDLHFMLAEAENHLGNWDPCGALLNGGIAGRFTSLVVDTTSTQWDSRYQDFITGNNASYPNIGICGSVKATEHELPDPTAEDYNLTEDERIKVYDLELLDEMLLEYPGEGRVQGMLLRMALRYNDMSIIADRVVPKYPESMQEAIRSKIENGDYYVNWDF